MYNDKLTKVTVADGEITLGENFYTSTDGENLIPCGKLTEILQLAGAHEEYLYLRGGDSRFIHPAESVYIDRELLREKLLYDLQESLKYAAAQQTHLQLCINRLQPPVPATPVPPPPGPLGPPATYDPGNGLPLIQYRTGSYVTCPLHGRQFVTIHPENSGCCLTCVVTELLNQKQKIDELRQTAVPAPAKSVRQGHPCPLGKDPCMLNDSSAGPGSAFLATLAGKRQRICADCLGKCGQDTIDSAVSL